MASTQILQSKVPLLPIWSFFVRVQTLLGLCWYNLLMQLLGIFFVHKLSLWLCWSSFFVLMVPLSSMCVHLSSVPGTIFSSYLFLEYFLYSWQSDWFFTLQPEFTQQLVKLKICHFLFKAIDGFQYVTWKWVDPYKICEVNAFCKINLFLKACFLFFTLGVMCELFHADWLHVFPHFLRRSNHNYSEILPTFMFVNSF